MIPWAATFDFGVVHAMAFPACRGGEGPVVETLQAIVDDVVFGAVEIAPIKNPAVRAQAQALLAASGLQVVYLPILPVIIEDLGLGSADVARRQAALDRLRILLDEAIAFGAPLAMLTGPRDPGMAERPATIERLVEDLRVLCDYADARSKRNRLHITLENFDREIEKKRLIGPTTEAAALADAVDHDNFGLTVDLSHLPLLGESSAHALRTAGRHLIHAHIGNCVAHVPDSKLYGDFHPRFGHPEGCNDLPEVVTFLRELNTLGYWDQVRRRLGSRPIMTMEIRPSDESSATALANGKRTMLRAWSLAMQPD